MGKYPDFGKKSKRLEKNIEKYERGFAKRKYKGHLCGKLVKAAGKTSPMATIALLALNSTVVDDGVKTHPASQFSGALSRILAYETGCKVFFNRRKIGKKQYSNYMEQLKLFLSDVDIAIVLRCHESSQSDKTDLTVSVQGKDDNKDFIEKLIQYTAEYTFGNYSSCVEVKEFDSELGDLIPANKEGMAIVCIDYNLTSFESKKEQFFLTLKRFITAITNMDWLAESKGVYRLWQADAKAQIPQDKVELCALDDGNIGVFEENSFLHIRSYYDVHETVRLRKTSQNSLKDLREFLPEKGYSLEENQFAVLTNRMIENLYGREWYEDKEEEGAPGLFGIPVIVYENERESYEVGIPKANQVDKVSLSTELYNEKIKLSPKYDYMIFNRFSDSRMFIKVDENSDYEDNGRVKAKKVMLPRYYRLMMGYLERPLKTIREEEYIDMYRNLDESIKKDFDTCYEKMRGQAYYQLKEDLEKEDDSLTSEQTECKERVTKHLESLGAYKKVSLIRIPKQEDREEKKKALPLRLLNRIYTWILKIVIGKAEYILKTYWAGDTDDKNNVARLNSNMMNLIGVSENDKILIRFGKSMITLRVLINDDLSDYEIGIPAPGRRELDMNSMNDIVIVHRDMRHTFKRHSQEQTLAILGTILAVAQFLITSPIFTKSGWGVLLGILVCLILIAFMLYVVLGEERVKVK